MVIKHYFSPRKYVDHALFEPSAAGSLFPSILQECSDAAPVE